MSRRECSPLERANCPLREHFKDWHHLYFPRRQVETSANWADWRNDPTNGRTICRYLHNAIHDSGYIPSLPTAKEMRQDLQEGFVYGAQAEYEYQLEVAYDYLEDNGDVRAS